MTHVTPAGAGTAARPTKLSTARAHLDRGGLRAGIARRRQTLANLEASLVTACEQAAVRGIRHGVRVDDRATWDRATWQRYLAAAAQLEAKYGPPMRRLLQEIDQLERLIALPLAA